MPDFGKMLIGLGLVIAFIGVLFVVSGKLNLPLGRLPGDITYRGKNVTVFFPLATSIVISIVLSVILWIISRR